MKDTVVFDLDGTLANIDHRLHFIKREKPDWDGFFKACVDDSVNEWCAEMISAFNSAGKTVLIVSARSKMVEKETEDWILKHVGPFARLLLLREEGNTTPDDELKINWLHKFGKERILFVVDDRQRVVDMWRKEGLVCLQCYAWPEWKSKKDTPARNEGQGKEEKNANKDQGVRSVIKFPTTQDEIAVSHALHDLLLDGWKFQGIENGFILVERNWEWKPSQCLNQIEPASDTPEKLNDFIEQFRLYFAHLARKYPERTLFTEGRDPIQDELVGLHHLAESSDTPARTEWVEKLEKGLLAAIEVAGLYIDTDDHIKHGIPKNERNLFTGNYRNNIHRIREALALVGKEK